MYGSRPQSALTLEGWLAGIPEPTRILEKPTASLASPVLAYAGSACCEPCHAKVYAAWQGTGMKRMFQAYAKQSLLADFKTGVEFHDDSGQWTVHAGGDEEPYFEFAGKGKLPRRCPVNYVIGSKWQQAYATRLDDGRIQVFPLQYNRLAGRWLNYWKEIDPPGSERAEPFPATNYQSNCAICHTSQLQAADVPNRFDLTRFREPGIGCEMCHGPSLTHVEERQRGASFAPMPFALPIRFSKVDHRTGTKICSQCHRQSSLREAWPSGEMTFNPAEVFFSDFKSRFYKEFSRRAFYKDGRFRETTFTSGIHWFALP